MESSILEARSIMQNHIDKQYDIMEENKRSLRRQIDQHRNDSESKHSGTSSEEDSTEKKEGSDTDSSIDSEDEELPPLGHGDRVEAKFSSSKTKGTGSISKVNHRKQTYNILFDNGKRRSNIPRSEITLIMSLSRPDHGHKRHGHGEIVLTISDDGVSISKGDRVEAKLKGWTKYYKGKITREKIIDGTYDILFDDGERKSKVDAKLIKSLEKKKTKKKTRRGRDSDSEDDDDDDVSLSKENRVEAKLKGWTKYYKGKITRENRDGTYDILFDDGERKSKVDAKLIKSLEKKKTKIKTRHGRDSDSDDDDDDDDVNIKGGSCRS